MGGMSDTAPVQTKTQWLAAQARSWMWTLLLVWLVWMTVQSLRGGVDVTGVAPDFAATDTLGKPLQLHDLRGKPTVLYFWATWCGACKLTSPTVEAFAKSHPDINVLAVADDDPAAVQAYLQDTPRQFRVALGNRATMQAYHIRALPTTVLLDAAGKIVWSRIGVLLPGELNLHVP